MRIKGRITGLSGWQRKLRTNYCKLVVWQAYCDIYGSHFKLGFKTPEAAWKANPVIQGTIDPRDFCRVFKNGVRWARS